MKEKKNPNKITLILSDAEGRNLKALLNRYAVKAPAYFHMLLANAYMYEFGGNRATKTGAPKPIVEDLTDEEHGRRACEAIGGKVQKRESDGILVCVIGTEWSNRSIPLDQWKRFPKPQ